MTRKLILKKIPSAKLLFGNPYFFDNISDAEVEQLLSGKPSGTFILRKQKKLKNYIYSVPIFPGLQDCPECEKSGLKWNNFIDDELNYITLGRKSFKQKIDNKLQCSRASCIYMMKMKNPLTNPKPISLQRICQNKIVDQVLNLESLNELPIPAQMRNEMSDYYSIETYEDCSELVCDAPIIRDNGHSYYCHSYTKIIKKKVSINMKLNAIALDEEAYKAFVSKIDFLTLEEEEK